MSDSRYDRDGGKPVSRIVTRKPRAMNDSLQAATTTTPVNRVATKSPAP